MNGRIGTDSLQQHRAFPRRRTLGKCNVGGIARTFQIGEPGEPASAKAGKQRCKRMTAQVYLLRVFCICTCVTVYLRQSVLQLCTLAVILSFVRLGESALIVRVHLCPLYFLLVHSPRELRRCLDRPYDLNGQPEGLFRAREYQRQCSKMVKSTSIWAMADQIDRSRTLEAKARACNMKYQLSR